MIELLDTLKASLVFPPRMASGTPICVLERQTILDAVVRIEALEQAIIKHRDQRGDDRCWLDDLELYALVGGAPDNSLPPKEKFLANCARFYDNRCQNAGWRSYQEIESALTSTVTSTLNLLTDVAQILDGWHNDGTAWSEWDEQVRQRVTALQQQLYKLKPPKPA